MLYHYREILQYCLHIFIIDQLRDEFSIVILKSYVCKYKFIFSIDVWLAYLFTVQGYFNCLLNFKIIVQLNREKIFKT